MKLLASFSLLQLLIVNMI